jgi:hypothetical protein
VANVSWWLSPDVQDLLKDIDDAGAIYLYVLGDMHIHTAVVRLLMPSDQILRFVGWGYAHVGYRHLYGVAQSGMLDDNPASTIENYFDMGNVSRKDYAMFVNQCYEGMFTATAQACSVRGSRDSHGCFC